MPMSFIRGLITRTLEEVVLLTTLFISNKIPDLTIFSSLRSYVLRLIISVGKKTRIKKGIYIGKFGKVIIGKNCFINRNVILDSGEQIKIGSNVSIGFNVLMTTSNHLEKGKSKNGATVKNTKIVVKNGTWIGSNVIVLPGAVIEENCIVGAGSVVVGRLKANGLYAGVPAKYIRETKGIVPKKY